jgi:signal transduction histidine kinase/CheY-like chemotaxis protein
MPIEGSARLAVFAQLLDRMREPFLIASRDGQVRAANAAGADALGTSIKALDGASLETYSPDPMGLAAKLRRPSVELHVPLRARDGRRFSCDATSLTSDLLLIRLSSAPVGESRGRGLFESLSRLSALAATEGEGLEAVTGALLTQGVSSIGALAGGIFLVDEAQANLELKVAASYPDEHAERYRLIPLSARLPITDAVKTASPIFLEGPADYRTRYPEFTKTHPEITESAFVALPIEVDGTCIGALIVGFATPLTFSAQERAFLSFLALQCAKAIARARAAELSPPSGGAERAPQRLERLQTFTGALAEAITAAQVVEAVVDMGIEATSASAGELWLMATDDTNLCLSHSTGANALRAEDHQHVPLDRLARLPVLDAVEKGLPIWIESRGQLEEQYPQALAELPRTVTSLACVPLFAQGRCIGGLTFTFDGVHRFLEDERAFLQLISWYSAQAVERARLYSAERRAKEKAEENQRRSDFMADIGTLLASSLDASDILRDVARAAVPRVADWCIVKLADPRLDTTAFANHIDPEKTSLVLQLTERFAVHGDDGFGVALVVRTGKSQCYARITKELVTTKFGSSPELLQLIETVGTASAMVVPISVRGVVLGAIVLNRCSAERPYDEHDLTTAEELGRRVGLAVDNARLYREAREADRLKDEFLAMLSHEIRNPLAPIQTALELMNLRDGDTFTRERAVISRHVQQVVRLVDDLLDVSRITRGKIQLTKQGCELSSILTTAIEMARPLSEKRSHLLTVEAPDVGLPVVVDHARMAQAIGNVLTNAAKYTAPGGRITLRASVEDADVVIRIRDSGAGIAPSLLPRVFDLFVQGESSLDRAPGGLGIGLTVVKSMVHMHGGTVSAHSDGLGHGSEFVIRLPLASSDVIAVRARSERPPRPTNEHRRVLVVDDNQDAASLLGEALDALGWLVCIVHDGPTAIAAARSFKPQLVLLDIGLPVMDGYELARNLRLLDLDPAMRVIAVTGYGQASDRERSRNAGFDEHVVKPVNLDTLRKVLERRAEPA